MTHGPHQDRHDKIAASLLGGAIGDALGAPLEGERDFNVLFEKFGPGGVQEFVAPISPFDDKAGFALGETTDDTACVMGTAAALHLAAGKEKADLLRHLWQANLVWGAHQMGGDDIAKFVDPEIKWPEWYVPFFESTGAGRGTIAALLEGRMGTPEEPMNVSRVVRGKHVTGPNKGCGGMMRVAPIGLLPLSQAEIADLAVRSTAITHGAPEAQAASAVIALTLRHAFNGVAPATAAYQAMEKIESLDIEGHVPCRKAFSAAATAAIFLSVSCVTANGLPDALGYKNEFLAIPVLSQVLYGTFIADTVKAAEINESAAFLQTLGYCSTISGDSDSVGSILGNILGAAWGTNALPEKLLNQVSHRHSLNQASAALNQTIMTMERL